MQWHNQRVTALMSPIRGCPIARLGCSHFPYRRIDIIAAQTTGHEARPVGHGLVKTRQVEGLCIVVLQPVYLTTYFLPRPLGIVYNPQFVAFVISGLLQAACSRLPYNGSLQIKNAGNFPRSPEGT